MSRTTGDVVRDVFTVRDCALTDMIDIQKCIPQVCVRKKIV